MAQEEGRNPVKEILKAADIADRVGVHVRTELRKNLSYDSKIELALQLNECRRHLTPADKKKLAEERVTG